MSEARRILAGVAACALTLLSACTLDITDLEDVDAPDRSTPPALSVRIELEVDDPATALARARIGADFFAGNDAEGRARPGGQPSPMTLGSVTIPPESHTGTGLVRWQAVESIPFEGDTLRIVLPVVEGLAPLPEMVVPVGLEIDPAGDIELASGEEIEISLRSFDDHLLGSFPTFESWSVTLGDALSVSGRRMPPRVRLPRELVDDVDLPAELRIRSARSFLWEEETHGAYRVQLIRSNVVRLTVTRTGSDP